VPRIYLDSCVVIYLHEGPLQVQQRIWARMKSVSGGSFCISDLVCFECAVGPLKRGDAALLGEYDAFFALPEIVKVPLGGEAFRLGARIRAGDGLKTPDALHVAAAIEGRCDAIWTNNDDIDKAQHRIRVERILT
jgi:predicted nucleic acid-binding protein